MMDNETEEEEVEDVTTTHTGPTLNVVTVETSGSAFITGVIIICITILLLGFAGGGM